MAYIHSREKAGDEFVILSTGYLNDKNRCQQRDVKGIPRFQENEEGVSKKLK